MQSDGSKYVRETGPGYQGVAKMTSTGLSVGITTIEAVDWPVGERIHFRTHADGVVATPDGSIPDAAHLGTRTVCRGNYRHLTLPGDARDYLGVEEGGDARIYEHELGLLLVDADHDPRVSRKIVTDGGRPEHQDDRDGGQDSVSYEVGR